MQSIRADSSLRKPLTRLFWLLDLSPRASRPLTTRAGERPAGDKSKKPEINNKTHHLLVIWCGVTPTLQVKGYGTTNVN